jgi:hypothetical protein
MNARLASVLLMLLTVLCALARSQTVVTFDDIPLNNGTGVFLQNNYQGLVWSNFAVVNGFLAPHNDGNVTNGFYYGVVSPSNVAIVDFNIANNDSEIDSQGSNFNFLSASFTGGWDSNLDIEVQGFRSGNLLYDTTVVVSATSPTLFTFNDLDIDRLDFSTSGGLPAFNSTSFGNFAMDNFTFEFIPEPSSLLLTALGAATLFAVVRRKQV